MPERLTAGGGPAVTLIWVKRVWRCAGQRCARRTWTGSSEPTQARASLTERARAEACRRVGEDGHDVAAVEYGVGWGTVMRAVRDHGRPLVDDPARPGGVAAIGADQTAFLAASSRHHTRVRHRRRGPDRPARLGGPAARCASRQKRRRRWPQVRSPAHCRTVRSRTGLLHDPAGASPSPIEHPGGVAGGERPISQDTSAQASCCDARRRERPIGQAESVDRVTGLWPCTLVSNVSTRSYQWSRCGPSVDCPGCRT